MTRRFNKQMFILIWTLAWPTMLEQLMQTALQYIDTLMVGSLGTQAVAAVGATNTISWLVGGSISAIGIGFLSYVAKACGANQIEEAKHAASQSVLAVLIVGILLTGGIVMIHSYIPIWMQVDPDIHQLSATYFLIIYSPILFRCASIIFATVLRAAGDTKTPMKIGFIVNVINVVLNLILIYPTRTIDLFGLSIPIFGMGWQVLGAGIASALSYTIGGILTTYTLYMHPYISPKGYSIRADWHILKPCLKIAFPNMLQRFGTSLGYVFFASMINSLGEVATAAHTIANTVESAFYIPGYGMQSAAATLSGNAYGAKNC
ncbi:MAG: MATE family efflux transporter, partial [Traorella sp.]